MLNFKNLLATIFLITLSGLDISWAQTNPAQAVPSPTTSSIQKKYQLSMPKAVTVQPAANLAISRNNTFQLNLPKIPSMPYQIEKPQDNAHLLTNSNRINQNPSEQAATTNAVETSAATDTISPTNNNQNQSQFDSKNVSAEVENNSANDKLQKKQSKNHPVSRQSGIYY